MRLLSGACTLSKKGDSRASSQLRSAPPSAQRPTLLHPSDPKTHLGNVLAKRSFVLLRAGKRYGRPCAKEQPRLSKMAWTRAWKALEAWIFRGCHRILPVWLSPQKVVPSPNPFPLPRTPRSKVPRWT